MQKCIVELIKMEREWIPKEEGYSLYVRPTVISTFPVLGVQPSQEVLAYVILSPVGPYYKSGFNPVKLYASPDYVRAWPGGTGFAKCGGNYAMTMLAQEEARRKGYTQVLWLYGDDHQVTEVGTMNQFFMWRRPGSKDAELVTAPLDGTILAGVTRDSILQLARKWGEFEVSERHFTMGEVIKAIEEGRMLEAFGCGTAAIVSPVESIFFTKTSEWRAASSRAYVACLLTRSRGRADKEYRIPVDPKLRAGPVAHRFMRSILDIQYGRTPHPWSVVID
jgi:branched-chain amino acid aminotransferase